MKYPQLFRVGVLCERTSRGRWFCPLGGDETAGLGHLEGDVGAAAVAVTGVGDRLSELACRLAAALGGLLLPVAAGFAAVLLQLGFHLTEERQVGARDGDQRGVGDGLVAEDERLLEALEQAQVLFLLEYAFDQFELDLVVVESGQAVGVVLTEVVHTILVEELDVAQLEVRGHLAANRHADVRDACLRRDRARLGLALAGPIDGLGVGDDAVLLAGALELRGASLLGGHNVSSLNVLWWARFYHQC